MLTNPENRPPTISDSLKPLLWLALMFCAAIILAATVSGILTYFIQPGPLLYQLQSAAQAIFGFIPAAYFGVRRFTVQPCRSLGLTQRVSWRPFAGVAIIYILAVPMMNWLVDINEKMTLPGWAGGMEGQLRAWENAAQQLTFQILSSSSVGGLLLNILIIGLLTALAEEMFFRGALQRMVARIPSLGGWSAVWIAAFIFSAAHFQFFGFLPRFLIGVFFGYLLMATGSLWPGVFAHALNNSLVVLSTWLMNHGDQLAFIREYGAVESGQFPIAALVSALLTATFLYFGHNRFFSQEQIDK